MSLLIDWAIRMITATTARSAMTIERVVIDSTTGTIDLTLHDQSMNSQIVTLHSVRPQDRAPLVMPYAKIIALLDETGDVSYIKLPDGSLYAAYPQDNTLA